MLLNNILIVYKLLASRYGKLPTDYKRPEL